MRPGQGVLVVDDDPTLVELMVEMLTRAGFEATSAPDAAQALIQAEALRPRLLICDIMMPAWGSGLDVYRRIREHPILREVPILFMTAMPPERVRGMVPPDPRVRILFKPTTWVNVRTAIEELLPGQWPTKPQGA